MPTKNGSGSREKGFKNHIVVLVVADLYRLPALALEQMSRGQGKPSHVSSGKQTKPWEIPMAFCF
jgi:hypothetical protein